MHKEIITSLQNESVKQTLALREARGRREYGLTLIDGLREISRALDAGVLMERVYYCPFVGRHQECQELLARIRDARVKVLETTPSVFEKMAFGQRAEGLLGVCRVPERSLIDIKPKGNSLFVIAQALEKPGNIGAILRSCDAAGVDGLLLVDAKTDLYNPNVIRASTGTVFTVPVASASSQAVYDFLKRYKISSCGLFPQAKELFTQIDFTGPVAIVLGSEDQGLNEFWHEHADIKMKLPMLGIADSLNVSVCGAIVVYEALRQRGLGSNSPVQRRSAKKF